MTQFDSWDTVYFDKARASFDNYEESDELSKNDSARGVVVKGAL
jgi:hypothetical protein